MPSAPFSCSSSGIVTEFSTTSAPAPMYWAETATCGGTSGGNCAIGSVSIETPPARMMISAMAEAKIGRVMKKFTTTHPHRGGPSQPIHSAAQTSKPEVDAASTLSFERSTRSSRVRGIYSKRWWKIAEPGT